MLDLGLELWFEIFGDLDESSVLFAWYHRWLVLEIQEGDSVPARSWYSPVALPLGKDYRDDEDSIELIV